MFDFLKGFFAGRQEPDPWRGVGDAPIGKFRGAIEEIARDLPHLPSSAILRQGRGEEVLTRFDTAGQCVELYSRDGDRIAQISMVVVGGEGCFVVYYPEVGPEERALFVRFLGRVKFVTK